MSDAAPAEQDQPIDAPEAPETDQPTGGDEESFTDSYNPDELPEEARGAYEEAYKRLQGAYTQKTQTLAEERREAETATQIINALRNPNPQLRAATLAHLGIDERAALEMYGYQAEEQEPDEFTDPEDRIARLEQTLAQRQQAEQAQQQEAAVTDYIAEQIEALEGKVDREFEKEEQQFLDAYARQFARNGVPDVEGAYKLLDNIGKSREKAVLDPKRNVPRVPGNGKSASRTVDLSKESNEERKARMAEAVEQAAASAQ
jgi:hypothetical protein